MDIESLNISREAYPYLVLQRGALDDMKGDPGTWCAKYIDVLYSEFRLIEPYLPATCRSILDVGSGLGGIDALLNDHYGGDCQVTLLDGVDDPPDVSRHNVTFNHMQIAEEFLLLNGVTHFDFIDANDAHSHVVRQYDLVVSFKSWCFHVEPERYLDLVLSACTPKHTQLFVDVRGGRRARLGSDAEVDLHHQYMRALSDAFQHRGMLYYGIKVETHHFEAR